MSSLALGSRSASARRALSSASTSSEMYRTPVMAGSGAGAGAGSIGASIGAAFEHAAIDRVVSIAR